MTYLCRDEVCHHKSDLPQALRRYVDYVFSSEDSDFDKFNASYKRYIKSILPWGYTIESWNKGYFYLSGVIKTPVYNYIYFNISDVRYEPNCWFTDILIRAMEHKEDWCGGFNCYTCLFTLAKDLEKLEKETCQ